MSSDITDELNRRFDLAALRREAQTLKTSRQWKKAFDLTLRCGMARDKETRLYTSRYQSRVETVRRRLVDEAGEWNRDFKHPAFGADNFAPDTTLRQARREVERYHEARIARIDESERQKLREIVTQSMRENNLTGRAREDFLRATDRRDGKDRREGKPRTRDR